MATTPTRNVDVRADTVLTRGWGGPLMNINLTDRLVKTLPTPASGNKTYFDATIKGFGVRVTAAGARAFVLNYRTRSGRERRYTIGRFPEWSTVAARTEAKKLRLDIAANGADPVGNIQAEKAEPTMQDLVEERSGISGACTMRS